MQKQIKKVFYADGLRFSCTRCSDCCRHEPGYVFLSESDLQLLAKELKIQYTNINKMIDAYCRWVPVAEGQKLSLKEKANFDCIFWQGGCTVYQSRPLQCRTFPFWETALRSPEAWKALSCPGAGRGELRSLEYIEDCLERRKAEPVMVRRA
ncbi:MAG: YkgJ family cysteine cluster protein [Spirochaetaceae bacterium]|jgi:Fe-S-cluster containining protein|nr:YkgJ family cysteine cluster protein [Spirochaetaceae bacterium]